MLEKAQSVKFDDRPVPPLQSPHHVIVRVNYTGICGSDVHYWQDGAIGDMVVRQPMVLGHESSGVVTTVGSAVSTLRIGDRVCMEPGVPCRLCVRCKEGRYNLCPEMRFAATPPIDGTLAKFYTLPGDLCYRLPDSVSLQEGAVVEPLSVAVHICRQAAIQPGQSVIVFGAGPIGLLCCAVAKAYGANTIVSVDKNEMRLNFARNYAATHTVVAQKESGEDAARRICSVGELGVGADAVMDATGAEPCINAGMHALRGGGTYVQGGMGAAQIQFPIMTVCTKELTVKGSFRYGPGDYATAIGLLESGRVSVKALISGVVAFADAESAFQQTLEAKGIKILIEGVSDEKVRCVSARSRVAVTQLTVCSKDRMSADMKGRRGERC